MTILRRPLFILSAIFMIYLLSYFKFWRSSSSRYFGGNFFADSRVSHWLILHSSEEIDEYLRASDARLPIIFDNDDRFERQLKGKKISFINVKSNGAFRFRSNNRKLLMYLVAIQNGARLISQTNSNLSFASDVQHVAFRRSRSPLINIYPTFTANFTDVVPGLPKEELLNITQDGWSSIRIVDREQETIVPMIQQQIIINVKNRSLFVNHPPVAVEPFTFTPFSNENLLFSYDAFWALIVSESKSTIWRSWWVQRLLWDIGGHVVYSSSFLPTDRPSSNEKTREDPEIGRLVRYLDQWKSTKPTLVERIETLITDLVEQGFCPKSELIFVQNWLSDLKYLNYAFPAIKPSITEQKSSSPVRRRRVAVCLTGLIECIEEAWRPTARAIRSHIQGEMDTFMYLSSTEPVVDQLSTVSLHLRIIEALRYRNFTVKVLFENIPKLDPHFPPNCTNDSNVNQPEHKVPRYYQQLFGLANCFALVRDYEKKHNIKYDLMVRSRADIEFLRIPDTFERAAPHSINTTVILPPNRFSSTVDDGFAVGPIDKIEVYMNRYFSFQQCLTQDLHPERYLQFYLAYRKVPVLVDGGTIVAHIPHARGRCH